MRLLICLALTSLLLQGCGQKGPLYKSPEKQTNHPQAVPAQPQPSQQ